MLARDRYIVWLERLYVSLFGVPVGDNAKVFIRQLHWSMFGGVAASGVLFVVSVLAARLLGTAEYGKYSFALAIAQMLALLITWSFEMAIVRALAFTRGDNLSQTYIISSAVFFLIGTAAIVHLLSFLVPLTAGKEIILIFATVLAGKLLFDGIIRGLGFFAYQAIGKLVEAFTVLVSFGMMVYFGFLDSYSQYLLAVLMGAFVLLVLYIFRIRSDVSITRISRSAFQVLWTYGSRAIVWVVLSTVLGFAAKFIIGYELGYEFLGQFTAYYIVSIGALSFVGGLVVNVLFPLAVHEDNTDAIWSKVNRTAAFIWFPLWVCSSLATTIAITLYGSSYYLSWWFGVGVAGIGTAQFLCGMYWSLIASKGLSGIWYASLHATAAGCVFIVLLFFSISSRPLLGILASYIASDIYMAWAIYRWRTQNSSSSLEIQQ